MCNSETWNRSIWESVFSKVIQKYPLCTLHRFEVPYLSLEEFRCMFRSGNEKPRQKMGQWHRPCKMQQSRSLTWWRRVTNVRCRWLQFIISSRPVHQSSVFRAPEPRNMRRLFVKLLLIAKWTPYPPRARRFRHTFSSSLSRAHILEE